MSADGAPARRVCAAGAIPGSSRMKRSSGATGTGRIQPGQDVRLLYDAFPYQRYGIKLGRVHWVSPASVTVRDRQVFRVLVTLNEQTLQVKGEPRRLMAGMSGRADVVVGRRSLLDYAFEPVWMLRETLSDRRPSSR